MKNFKITLSIIGLLGLTTLLQSCVDTDSTPHNTSIGLVTVCPNEDGSFIMNLNETTVLRPTNMKTSPFGKKEVRALVNYTETPGLTTKTTVKDVQVLKIDSIRTKTPVAFEPDAVYGNDPIDIIKDWVTIAEDGYLTMRIRTSWGGYDTKHIIDLVTGVNPDDPYEMELHHNACGDIYGQQGDALIAFNLNSLPDFDGTVKLKLRWKSFGGEKTAEFDLKMRNAEDPEIPDSNPSTKLIN